MITIAQSSDEPASTVKHPGGSRAQVTNLDTIPVIDFAPSFSASLEDRRRVAREIHSTCRSVGFFYAINHGDFRKILCAAQLDWSKRYFELPLEEKLKVDMRQSKAAHGYEALAQQVLDPGAPPDLKEGFYIGVDRGPGDPLVIAGIPNHGPNQWPEHLSGFREQMTDYFQCGAGPFASYYANSCAVGSISMRPISMMPAPIPDPYSDWSTTPRIRRTPN